MPGWMTYKLESRFLGKIISNLKYADDTTLMAESEEELKSLWMRVKDKRGKAGLKLNIQQIKIMASNFMANGWVKSGNSDIFYFLGHQSHCRWLLQP